MLMDTDIYTQLSLDSMCERHEDEKIYKKIVTCSIKLIIKKKKNVN